MSERSSNVACIEKSQYFDKAWYLNEYPDVARVGIGPAEHYLRIGAALLRNPGPSFDTAFYLKTYPDVARANLNPLLHYEKYGRKEHRCVSQQQKPLAESAVASQVSQYVKTETAEQTWLRFNEDVSRLRKNILSAEVGKKNFLSIVIPVYNPPLRVFKECVASTLNQDYENYEVILVDDRSTDPAVVDYLRSLQGKGRVKVVFREENGHISRATNSGAQAAAGEYLVFVDNDDLLAPHALSTVNLYLNRDELDIVYSDEYRVDAQGKKPHGVKFKPGFSPEMLLAFCYFSHLVVMRKSLFEATGGFRVGYEGSQDHDLWLRATEMTSRVGHIPQKLYIRRVLPGSTAAGGDQKLYAYDAAFKAVREAFARRGVDCEVVRPDWAQKKGYGIYSPVFPHTGPEVCIVVPTMLNPKYLLPLLLALNATAYKNFRVVFVCNNFPESEFKTRLAETVESMDLRFSYEAVYVPASGPFNFSALNNAALRDRKEPLYLFLNDDVEPNKTSWLSQLVGWSLLPGVSIVGIKLLYPKGKSIQHCGVAHGLNFGTVGTLFRHYTVQGYGHQYMAAVTRNVSAVTAACMLVKAEAFKKVGGFDEKLFPVTYSDVDLCYRIVAATGERVVLCNEVSALHHESASRPSIPDPAAIANYKRLYAGFRENYVNPGVNFARNDMEPLNRIIAETIQSVRVVLVSHNLNFEGAPISLFHLALFLVRQQGVSVCVWSPVDGPLRERYDQTGIEVLIGTDGTSAESLIKQTNRSADSGALQEAVFDHIAAKFPCDIIIANTLLNFWAVNEAFRRKIPAVWIIRESEGLSRRFATSAPTVLKDVVAAFATAYRIVYVAKKTCQVYQEYIQHHNYEIIPNGLMDAGRFRPPDVEARAALRASLGYVGADFVIVQVGTICERKNQRDLLIAFRLIKQLFPDLPIKLLLVGARETDAYCASLMETHRRLPDNVRAEACILPEQDSIEKYLKVADLFCFTSKMESYPRVLLEATAAGLPIVSTDIMGTSEMVIPGNNGVFYTLGNVYELAMKLLSYALDRDMCARHSQGSSAVFDCLTSYEEMGRRYLNLIHEGVLFEPAERQ